MIELWCGLVKTPEREGIFGLPEEGEDIHTRLLGRQEAYEWIAEGKIYNAATIIALQWLQLNRQGLLERWAHLL